VRLRIVDGELQVRSPAGMRGYLTEPEGEGVEGWRATGDRVMIEGDRVYFQGRESERINVGGLKLFPSEVERVLLTVPGVRAARVHGLPSAMTGQIVAADIVLAANVERTTMRASILTACRERLPAHKLPRILRFVETLDVTAAGKLRRE
jgi:acyl-CoA synthetase (AMP-forming)/AMP-acid ligase II